MPTAPPLARLPPAPMTPPLAGLPPTLLTPPLAVVPPVPMAPPLARLPPALLTPPLAGLPLAPPVVRPCPVGALLHAKTNSQSEKAITQKLARPMGCPQRSHDNSDPSRHPASASDLAHDARIDSDEPGELLHGRRAIDAHEGSAWMSAVLVATRASLARAVSGDAMDTGYTLCAVCARCAESRVSPRGGDHWSTDTNSGIISPDVQPQGGCA